MIRTRRAVLGAALFVAALVGCSSESEPTASSANGAAATPATTSAAPVTTGPAPIADDATIRRLCNTIADLGNSLNFDSDANLAAGQRAELIVDPKFSLPGRGLVKAAGAASAAPGPDTNIDIAQVSAYGLTCPGRYG